MDEEKLMETSNFPYVSNSILSFTVLIQQSFITLVVLVWLVNRFLNRRTKSNNKVCVETGRPIIIRETTPCETKFFPPTFIPDLAKRPMPILFKEQSVSNENLYESISDVPSKITLTRHESESYYVRPNPCSPFTVPTILADSVFTHSPSCMSANISTPSVLYLTPIPSPIPIAQDYKIKESTT